MTLKEYKPGTTFPGAIGRTVSESEPAWPQPVRAKKGAPNVIFFILDDVGYGQMSAFGGLVNTPNLDRLVQNGLRYTNMYTTALCSSPRACVLTQSSFQQSALHQGMRHRLPGLRRPDALPKRRSLRDAPGARI